MSKCIVARVLIFSIFLRAEYAPVLSPNLLADVGTLVRNREVLVSQALAPNLLCERVPSFSAQTQLRAQFVSRLPLLHPEFTAHDSDVGRLLEAKPTALALSWAAGFHLNSFLVSTNSQKNYFVDDGYEYDGFESEWKKAMADSYRYVRDHLDENYPIRKYEHGFAESVHINTLQKQIAALLFELHSLGIVGPSMLALDFEMGFPRVHIQSSVNNPVNRRSVTFIQTDIAKPNHYPPLLYDVLNQGIELLYERAAFGLHESNLEEDRFFVNLIDKLQPGGFLLTDGAVGLRANSLVGLIEREIPNVPAREVRVWSRLSGHQAPFAPHEMPMYGWRMRIFQKTSRHQPVSGAA